MPHTTARDVLLLVEDNPDDAELALLAFEQSGVQNEVVIASDGVQAIEYLFGTGSHAGRDPEQLPALVLLDLQLPRLNGLQVLERIRNDDRTRLLPVVILTTSDEEQDLVRGYSLGCNSYIRKPVDYDQFLNVIQQLGLYWLALNTPPPLPTT